MTAHQAPLSLGFSRQEYWSGLPLPSLMHESEKWKESHSVVSDSSWPHGLQPTRLLPPWDFPGKSTGVGCHCLLRYLSLEKGNNFNVKAVYEGGRSVLLKELSKSSLPWQKPTLKWKPKWLSSHFLTWFDKMTIYTYDQIISELVLC